MATERQLECIDADAYESHSISKATRYQPFSRYPYIVRDVAAWIPGNTDEQHVRELIRREAGGLLVRMYRFDRFEKDGRVSLAFRLVLQSFNRTLQDDEANAVMEKVHAVLRSQGFEIR